MNFKKIINPKRWFRSRHSSNVEYHDVYANAYYLGLMLFLVSFIDLLLSLSIPVGAKSDAVEVYSRNFLSVACFALLGVFFVRLGYYGKGFFKNENDMKWFRILIWVVAVACFIKAAVSGYFAAVRFTPAGFVWVYYLGDAIAWLTIGAFLITYKRVKLAPKSKNVESRVHKHELDDLFNSAATERKEHEHHHHHGDGHISNQNIQPMLDRAFSDGVGKGFMDSNINTAKVLKNHNVPINIIMASTGLTEYQIRML